MATPPTVSVIIPTYNCAPYLQEALESVFAQTWRPCEVIVVDGSTDDTPTLLKRYGGRIHVLSQPPRGVAAARNAGMRQARGSYAAFLDGDDVWRPDFLARQVRALEAHPDAVLGFSDFTKFGQPDGFRETALARSQERFQYWVERHRADDGVSVGPLHDVLVWGNVIPTSSVVLRRAAAVSVGVFDEQFQVAEDYEYWLRLSLRFPVLYRREPLMAYRMVETGLSGRLSDRSTRFLTSHIRVLERHLAEERDRLSVDTRRTITRRLAILRYRLGAASLKAGDGRTAVCQVGRALRISRGVGLEFADGASGWAARVWLAAKPYLVWAAGGLSAVAQTVRAPGLRRTEQV
jgi:glycosyltransferase involved in cell wall biosynthesis